MDYHGPSPKSGLRRLLKHGLVQSYPLSKKPIRSPKIFAHEFGGPRGPRIFTAHRQAYLWLLQGYGSLLSFKLLAAHSMSNEH